MNGRPMNANELLPRASRSGVTPEMAVIDASGGGLADSDSGTGRSRDFRFNIVETPVRHGTYNAALAAS